MCQKSTVIRNEQSVPCIRGSRVSSLYPIYGLAVSQSFFSNFVRSIFYFTADCVKLALLTANFGT